ncbi:MAG: class I SAM-dependent methyltransferase [Myxococcota bacterium]|jgi:trans-aconitate methyltransferase|nr:class I SAM-dependent methyltransferase [Myxococcota bacterium]
MDSIASAWQTQPYRGMFSYTRTHQAELLLRVAHSALLDCVFDRLEHLTAGRRFEKAVDVACATGDWSRRCLQLADRVHGIDINPEFVRVAQERSEGNPRLSFAVEDMRDFDGFQGADLVFFAACLSCVDEAELRELLQRCVTQMKPGGIIYVRVTVVHPQREPHRGPIGHYRRKSFYDELFASFGLRTLSSEESNTLVAAELGRVALRIPRGGWGEQVMRTVARAGVEASSLRGKRHRFHNWILQLPRWT